VNKYKTIFEKIYTPNWTIEVFTIVKMQRTNPITYLLKDYREKPAAGAFYEHEMHRIYSSGRVSYGESTARRETRYMSSSWDLMDHTIHGYTKTMLLDKILIYFISMKCTKKF